MGRSDVESAAEVRQNLVDQPPQKILIRYHDDYDGPPLEKIEKLVLLLDYLMFLLPLVFELEEIVSLF